MANGHGGARPGAGRPKKPLAEKILEDNRGKRKPKVLAYQGVDEGDEFPDIPEWMSCYGSKTIGKPDSQDIYLATVTWLQKTGCYHLVPPEYITDYAIIKAAWYETHRHLERYGTIQAKIEKTDKDGKERQMLVETPFVDSSVKLYKIAEIAWGKIWAIVAQNSEHDFGGDNPHKDVMEFIIKRSLE